MTIKAIRKTLEKALLQDGLMYRALYEHELEELEEYLRQSMQRDNDRFIFAVTENNTHVAMVLIDQSGELYINEQARSYLQELWPNTYEQNMKKFIPLFARQLHQGDLPINGVKIV
jgi:hypothetical protein